jgi:hypothetical protein
MSLLFRQLPEFQRGRSLVLSGKWKSAIPEFSRSAEVMFHANQPIEHAVAGLYVSTCKLYTGDVRDAVLGFELSLLTLKQSSSLIAGIAGKFKISAQLELSEVSESVQSDGAIIETSDIEVLNHIQTSTESLNSLDTKISALPLANAEGVSVDAETESISQILRDGEELIRGGQPADEVRLIGKWIVARCLLMRGKLFQFNANALMAEAMYRASIEQATVDGEITLPRVTATNTRAHRELGKLLLNWEKRETEGKLLLNKYPEDPSPLFFERYIPAVTFRELDSISP